MACILRKCVHEFKLLLTSKGFTHRIISVPKDILRVAPGVSRCTRFMFALLSTIFPLYHSFVLPIFHSFILPNIVLIFHSSNHFYHRSFLPSFLHQGIRSSFLHSFRLPIFHSLVLPFSHSIIFSIFLSVVLSLFHSLIFHSSTLPIYQSFYLSFFHSLILSF